MTLAIPAGLGVPLGGRLLFGAPGQALLQEIRTR
jgi:hypothetical protein